MNRNFLSNAALFCAGLLVALVVSELLLRLMWHPVALDPQYKRDDFSWMSRAVVLNNFGYRDTSVLVNKNPETLRVYSLGDSYTYGWYIDDAMLTYPNLLEDYLKLRYGREKAEVINASQPGFNLEQSLDRFQSEGILFAPDIVMLGINIFDLAGREFPPSTHPFPFLSDLRLYELTFRNLQRAKVARLTEQELQEAIEPESAQLARAKKTIQELNKSVTLIGGTLVIVIFSNYDPANPNGVYRYKNFHEQIHNIIKKIDDLQQNQIIVVDLLKAFERIKDKRELILNPLDSHPSVTAHTIAKNEIVKAVDFDKVNKVQQNVRMKKMGIGDELEWFLGILSIFHREENWVYFNKAINLDVQKRVVEDTGERRLSFMPDFLKTAQSFTHDGWPGAEIEMNVPGSSKEILIPRRVYGYPVVGVHQITAFSRREGSTVARDLNLGGEIEIAQEKGGILIRVFSPGIFDFYRVNLDVGVSQIDIENKKAVSAFRTNLIRAVLPKGESSVHVQTQGRIGSLPKFVVNSNSFDYAWYSDSLRKVKITKKTEKSFIVEFISPAVEEVKIELPVAQELIEGQFEKPTVVYL